MKKENDRKTSLRYNEDMDSFDGSRSGMKGGKCVMAHKDKENDIEAAGRKLQITEKHINTSFTPCLQLLQLGTGRTLQGQHSSASGRQRC